MDKGISFYFGYDIPPEERIELIKKAGFNCVITSCDKKFDAENGSLSSQIKLFKKYGIRLTGLHLSYNTPELPCFWEKGRDGDRLLKTALYEIKLAHKYNIKNVVMHLIGTYSLEGEKRLLKILDLCSKFDINLAVENIDCPHLFADIFRNIQHEKLKFCYDSGHNNVFDKNTDYLLNYGDKLVALHLHDNNGKADEHSITPLSGTIDWDKIALRLSKLNEVSLDYETMNRTHKEISATTFLAFVKEHADNLENKIIHFRLAKD